MLTSFIPVNKESHFPIQNLPFSAFETEDGEIHLCSAIGDYVIDLFVLDEAGLFDGKHLKDQFAFQDSTLNFFMGLGKPAWQEARETLTNLLDKENSILRDDDLLRSRVFVPMEDVEMVMPGDTVKFIVKLIVPVALEEKQRFAIREGGKTVGAGVVTKINK